MNLEEKKVGAKELKTREDVVFWVMCLFISNHI